MMRERVPSGISAPFHEGFAGFKWTPIGWEMLRLIAFVFDCFFIPQRQRVDDSIKIHLSSIKNKTKKTKTQKIKIKGNKEGQ